MSPETFSASAASGASRPPARAMLRSAVSAASAEPTGRPQRRGRGAERRGVPRFLDRPGGRGQPPAQQVESLPEVGEVVDVGDHPQRELPVVLGRVRPGGVQVRGQRVQRAHGGRLVWGPQAPGFGGQPRGGVAGVPVPQSGLPGRVEQFDGVGAQRLQQGEPVVGSALHQRLLDEAGEQRRHRSLRQVVLGAHRLGLGEREPGGEHAEPPKQHRLGRGEQLVGPLEHGAQCAVAAVRGAAAPAEQVEPVGQALGQRGQPERGGAGGAELDGQRQPVQAAAQLGDERHPAVVVAAGELGQRAGAGEEQPDRRGWSGRRRPARAAAAAPGPPPGRGRAARGW